MVLAIVNLSSSFSASEFSKVFLRFKSSSGVLLAHSQYRYRYTAVRCLLALRRCK